MTADSERTLGQLRDMDNHGTRPEVRAAAREGTGMSRRRSDTLEKEMMYVAVAVGDPDHSRGPFYRVAMPVEQADLRIEKYRRPLARAAGTAFLAALLVAFWMSRRITAPLRNLVKKTRGGEAPDELDALGRTIADLSSQIEHNVDELAAERGRLSGILRGLVESVVAVDQEGQILLLNPAAERLFEVRAGEVMGKAAVEGLRHSALNALLTRALEARAPIREEIALHTPEERRLMAQIVPADYGAGRAGAVAVLHDITELRRLEGVRQEFVANVSHELRTPLTSIRGYVETLLNGALEDKTHNREFLEIIQDHAKHLSDLIEDVLSLSSIESKRVQYEFAAVEAKPLIDRILKALAPMAQARKVRFENDLPKSLPPLRADAEKLAQIFMNLLDNAVKFNKEGGSVRIAAKTAGDRVEFEVKDTGRGIPPEDLPRIFERFYRVEKSRTHDIPGTGLGLAIVKHLVDAHGGDIDVTSRPGEGTTFTLRLPAA